MPDNRHKALTSKTLKRQREPNENTAEVGWPTFFVAAGFPYTRDLGKPLLFPLLFENTVQARWSTLPVPARPFDLMLKILVQMQACRLCVKNPHCNKVRPFKGVRRRVKRVFFCSLGWAILCRIFMAFPLHQTLVQTLAKNLVNNLAKNLATFKKLLKGFACFPWLTGFVLNRCS